MDEILNLIESVSEGFSSFFFNIKLLHGPSMFAVMAKIYGVSINSPALSLLMKHLIIGQRLKTPNFSAFRWSPRGSLVSIGQHFIATRVVHLPKSTETSLITESDQSGLYQQLLQLCTARTAWSDSDQAVRAVHSCNSWLFYLVMADLARSIPWSFGV